METFLTILLALCFVHASYASDLCKAFYPKAECTASCSVADGHTLYDLSFLCADGVCCETSTATPDPNEPPENPTDDANTCGLAGRRLSKRSVGKDVPAACTWPWLVSITVISPELNIAKTHAMTGVLVSKRNVLVHKGTINSFTDSIPDLTVEAVTGEYYLNMDGDETSVYTINMAEKRDVGEFSLLALDTDVEVDSCIRPVCLSNETAGAALQMDQCKLIGWGKSETGTGDLTLVPVPLQASVTIDSANTCSRIFDFIPDTYNSSILCLEIDSGITVSDGDRGNPIICPDEQQHWHLKGLLTRGKYNTDFGFSGPFAVDVAALADQIQDELLPL